MRPLDRIAKGLSRAREAGSPGRAAGAAGGLLRGLFAVIVEVLRIAREMLMIPLQLWLALAEVAGRVVLGAWRIVRPLLVAAVAFAAAALRAGQRHVTPARALAVVCLGALVALAASQWLDYRGIGVGTEDYAGGVEAVAPPPDVDRQAAGDAHAWVMLPLAAAGVVLLGLAFAGRRGAARLLLPLGLAVIAVAILVDAPKGLDEGDASVAYQGAEARLLEGFWAQLAAGGVIAACGLLLPPRLRAASDTAVRRGASSRSSRRTTLQDLEPPSPGSSGLGKPPIEGTSA